MKDTFPFIALGTVVLYEGKEFVINGVDHTAKTFDIVRYKETPSTVVHGVPFVKYQPAPTLANLNMMLEEWDYYANMSEDERIVENARVQLRSMVDLFRKLSSEDQLFYRKVLALMVDEEFTRKT